MYGKYQKGAWKIMSNIHVFVVLLDTLLFLVVDDNEMYVDFFLMPHLTQTALLFKREEKKKHPKF